MKNIFAVAVLSFSLLIPQAALPAELEKMITDAYLSMLDADKLLKEEKPAEALNLYEQSLQSYLSLKELDPAYKPENVEYRIAQITAKIEELSKQLPGHKPAESTEPENIDPAEQDFKELYFQTREKMVKDSSRLLEMEKRNIQMTITLRERQQELEKLKQDLKGYERELASAKTEQSQASAALQKEVNDLGRFNNLLQDRADKLEITSAQLEKQRDDLLEDGRKMQDQLLALQSQHEAVKNELKETKRVSTLNEQTLILSRNQLQDDLEAKKVDLGNAEAKVAELQTKIKDLPLLEETVIELNRQNEAHLKQSTDLQTELASMNSAITDKEAVLNETQARLTALEQEKANWAAEREAALAAKTEWENKFADTDEVISELRKELEKAVKEKEAAEQERAEVLSKRKEYRDEMKAVANENKDLQKETDRMKKAFENWESEKAEVETKWEVKLAESEAERNRLLLNLQQESDQRKLLERNAEQQLKSITDRMNEIIALRQQISKLETALKQAAEAE